MAVTNASLLTKDGRVALANNSYNTLAANCYLIVGQQQPDTANDTLIPIPNNSTDYLNQVWAQAIALKQITASDLAFVVPRVDWQSGTVYAQWDNTVDMYATESFTALSGTINVDNSRTLTGTNTLFVNQITSGELVYIPGDGINVAAQILQVTDIFSNTSANVNTAVSGDVISNTLYLVSNTAPAYASPFYVRNSYDQVFVCLYNSGGAQSNTMPEISIGGNLPTAPFIITADGYEWRYLYTIASVDKQLFFNEEWMPVYADETVVASAVGGEIDVVLIEAGGSGYNGNVASNVATILTVTGDGEGANLSAVVSSNGTITGINILNGGSGYTYANVVVAAGSTGSGADLRVIIGPEDGHGADPVHELGATALMVCVPLSGSESNTIPTGASVGSGIFQFRQLSIVDSPVLVASGNVATNLNYSQVTTLTVQSPPAGAYFSIDETVYQGSTLSSATFSATVAWWDDVNDILWLNNLAGEFTPQTSIVGTLQTQPVTAFVLTSPEIAPFTGRIMYVNDIEAITRGPDQTEYALAVLQF